VGETRQALGKNTSVSHVIVVSQNTKMLQLSGWKNFVRCLADPACNGAGALQGYQWPMVQLLDDARARAGYTNNLVSLAIRHDDHFGTYKFTCPASNLPADAEFCNWKNSKIINDNMYPGSIKIMAGDWNYKAKACEHDGVVDTSWKYAYRCTTWHIGGCTSTEGNLGFTDPRSRQNPNVYDTASPVDYMHHKGASSTFLPTTAGNPTPGVLSKTFYGTADTEAWSDHLGLLMRFHY
jgi:hypothetical protein